MVLWLRPAHQTPHKWWRWSGASGARTPGRGQLCWASVDSWWSGASLDEVLPLHGLPRPKESLTPSRLRRVGWTGCAPSTREPCPMGKVVSGWSVLCSTTSLCGTPPHQHRPCRSNRAKRFVRPACTLIKQAPRMLHLSKSHVDQTFRPGQAHFSSYIDQMYPITTLAQ